MLRSTLVAALLVGIVGCAPDPEAPQDEPEPENDSVVPAGDWQSCTNPVDGYRIEYPEDWLANDGSVLPECSLFDPEPISVEPHGEIPSDIAIQIRREPTALDTLAPPRPFEEVLDIDHLEIDGRRAVRAHTRLTEGLLRPAGSETYAYYVELNAETLVAATYDDGPTAFATKREVLDEMVQRLRVDAE